MSSLNQDLRFALRTLFRRPGFAVIALVTLALGIGANTAMFSVVHAVLLRPLPFEDPDALVRVQGLNLATGEANNLSPADFMDFERESVTLSRLGAHGWIGPATLSDGRSQADRVGMVQVTEGFFPALAVQPALGRLFTPDEDLPGGDRVVILSHRAWRDRFGADPGIVGETVFVNALPTTVIGVLPATYRHIEERTDRTAEIFRPYAFDRGDPNRGGHFIRAVGRLSPGRALDVARAELTAIAARLEQEYPDSNTEQGVYLAPLRSDVVGEAGGTLLILLGAAGFVLLIACGNLANLLLAVGAGRRHELAVRSALGAGRRRLLRQLLTECVVLGVLGGAAGLLVAYLTTGLLTGLSAAGIPRAGDIGLNLAVLGFTAVIAVAATVGFGLAPAVTLASGNHRDALANGGRSPGGVRRWPREALIAGEIALSVVLVAGAFLLVGSLLELRGVPPGFESNQAVVMEVAPPLARYPEGTQIPFHRELEARARSIPGVLAAGAVNILPLTDNYDGRSFLIDARPIPEPGRIPSGQSRSVTPGYFEAMGIPLLRGRLFDARDLEDAPLVVLISQSMADRLWPGADPVGQRITYPGGMEEVIQEICPDVPFPCLGGPASREIIGVVADVKHLDLSEDEAVPMFYTPNTQPPSYHAMTWVLRHAGDPSVVTSSMRTALFDLDPEVPLAQVRTLDGILDGAVAMPRVRAGLIGAFALLAVLLAWVGVYGVVGYLTSRRTHEIGIRLALGASAGRVLGMLLRDGMRPVGVGIAVGIVGALGLSGLLRGILFGVTPLAPGAYFLAGGTLALAGLLAVFVPTWRAVRVSPVRALADA